MVDPGTMSKVPTAEEMEAFFCQSIKQIDDVQKSLGGNGVRLSFITRNESVHDSYSKTGNRRLRLRWKCYQGGGFVSIYLVKRGDLPQQRLWQCAYQHTYPLSEDVNSFLWHALVCASKAGRFEGVFGGSDKDGEYSHVAPLQGFPFYLFSGTANLYKNVGGGEESNKWVPRGTMTYSGGVLAISK